MLAADTQSSMEEQEHDFEHEMEMDELLSSVTLRETAGGIRSYQNTVAIACPSCGEPFDDVVVCEEEFTSLDLSMAFDKICTTVYEGDAVLFTHKP